MDDKFFTKMEQLVLEYLKLCEADTALIEPVEPVNPVCITSTSEYEDMTNKRAKYITDYNTHKINKKDAALKIDTLGNKIIESIPNQSIWFKVGNYAIATYNTSTYVSNNFISNKRMLVVRQWVENMESVEDYVNNTINKSIQDE